MLIFAAIAPHGGLAVEEWCSPEERPLAAATRAGYAELARRFEAARPDATIVATPHGIHVEDNFAVAMAGELAGSLGESEQPSARADGFWQLLMLHGALGDGWRGELLSYEAPTYFGMLCAAYEPK